jgi:ubiquinone/menaquinone biosynthesis C-methylase UbiE
MRSDMHEKRFEGDISRLRNPERLARLEVERVVTLCLEEAKIMSVLDVGTGTGVFAEAFATRGLAVTGIDVNPEMLPAARAYVPVGDFREGAAERLPFANANFDLIFMGLLLHESDEQLQVLSEARRVARKRVAILEWAFREEDFGAPLLFRLDPGSLVELAKESGFSQLEEIPLSKLVFYRLTI